VMNQSEQLARIRNITQAFNSQDVAATVKHLSADVTWSRGDGSSLRGRETLATHVRELFNAFPDASLSHVQLLAIEPDSVLIEWVLEATHLGAWRLPARQEPIPPTGRTVRVVGADLVRFNSAGEIASDDARIDTAALLTLAGILPRSSPDAALMRDLAKRYTAAWGSQDAASVASFYSADGSLCVNSGPPAVGHRAITDAAQGFMTTFPDMKVIMDGLLVQGDRAVYSWTLVGTNTGPGGTGKRVRISGFEAWRIGADGLIAESRGHFDSAAYQEQIARGVVNPE
jgi:ketosteroid isomerase-like protein